MGKAFKLISKLFLIIIILGVVGAYIVAASAGFVKDIGGIAEKTTDVLSGALVNAEFKETMDSCSEFVDEYIEFVNKADETDNATELLNETTDYLEKYNETMQKLSSVRGEDLGIGDWAYYMIVNLRIQHKLSAGIE